MLNESAEADLLEQMLGMDASNQTVLKVKSPEEIRNEWLEARRGFFTASCAGQLMGFEDKDELPAGAKTYAKKVAIERMTKFNPERPRGLKSAAMQWGNDNEVLALTALHEATGMLFESTGENQRFIKFNGDNFYDDSLVNGIDFNLWVGATPDGYVPYSLENESTGVEVKCPNSDTHFDYLQIETQDDFKKVCKDYYWQIHQLMLCTDCNHWYFVSFDPDFIDESKRLKILRIERNDKDIDRLIKRLSMAIEYAKTLID